MFKREFTCPSCGAPLTQTVPGARSLVCTFCGQTSHINADSLKAFGEKKLLIDYGSVFDVGKEGRIGEKSFEVLGCLRFDYDDGFWDEWFVRFSDGEEGWIQEDDGSFVMFMETDEEKGLLPYENAQPGLFVNFSLKWSSVFVTSRSRARVNGGKGELPFRIVPGEKADYAEGIHGGDIISVEYLPSETRIFIGRPIVLTDKALTFATT
ncbi:MAG: DUF4178 domain-containing protein [Bacteroidetes bacterium]|nr:MAG: DUF4178 domain-containing protein [Bacteroidota bacterium]